VACRHVQPNDGSTVDWEQCYWQLSAANPPLTSNMSTLIPPTVNHPNARDHTVYDVSLLTSAMLLHI
jgi:hypothetical protein